MNEHNTDNPAKAPVKEITSLSFLSQAARRAGPHRTARTSPNFYNKSIALRPGARDLGFTSITNNN